MSLPSRKLRVAVVLSTSETMGGAFVQSLNIARMLQPEFDAPYSVEYIVLERGNAAALRNAGFDVKVSAGRLNRAAEAVSGRSPMLRRTLRSVYHLLPNFDPNLDELAARSGYDVIFFTSPSRLALGIKRTPFVFTLWDICHRDHPEFPEISGDGGFEWRERLFRHALVRATAYVVDNASLAAAAARAYGADERRAVIVPLRPSPELLAAPMDADSLRRLREKYELKQPFVFYPAQFWPHKNHVYILQALKILKDTEGMEIGAVFCGSDQGTLGHVQRIAAQLRLADRIKFLGFLPVAEVAQMYKTALALVMPSYFGPSNIPPLEAAALGCHLIYSNEPGFPEYVGDGETLLCELGEPQTLAACIKAVLTRPPRRPQPPVETQQGRRELDRMLCKLAAKFATWRDPG